MSAKDRDELFRQLCDMLQFEKPKGMERRRKRDVSDILCEGIGFVQLGKLIDTAAAFVELRFGVHLSRKVAATESEPRFNSFWQALKANTGNGKAVILGVGGNHSHWTVVDRVTQARISLKDSDRLIHLNYSQCKYGGTTELWPRQSYFISIAQN
jgi:hypothetical protein